MSIINNEASAEAIEQQLNLLFSELNSGRKTAKDLAKEIQLGECQLEKIGVEIIRVVNVVNVVIPNPLDPSLSLWEVRQEYLDKIVERDIQGVSEKIQGSELPINAAIRALQEELGILVEVSGLEFVGIEVVDNPKSAYQGIKSKSQIHRFQAVIKAEDYLPEYREVQPTKTTIFQWR